MMDHATSRTARQTQLEGFCAAMWARVEPAWLTAARDHQASARRTGQALWHWLATITGIVVIWTLHTVFYGWLVLNALVAGFLLADGLFRVSDETFRRQQRHGLGEGTTVVDLVQYALGALAAALVVGASLWTVLFLEDITFVQLLREVADALAAWAANLYDGLVSFFKALPTRRGARRQ